VTRDAFVEETTPLAHGTPPAPMHAVHADSHPYEYAAVRQAMRDALRPFVKPGERLIFRSQFRWFDDAAPDAVLSNHFESMSIRHLAEDCGYEVLHDYTHLAIVRKKVAA
jgi:hypothetical protein